MAAEQLIISVSGLRGIVGLSLTPAVVMRYVAAFAAEIPQGAVVVTRDGRATGPMIAEIVRGTLCACGRDVYYGDVAATPTTGVLVRELQAAGGVQISASHNPAEYNGLKLFGGDGRVLSENKGAPILRRYEESSANWVPHDTVGRVQHLEDTTSVHVNLVLNTVNVKRIREQGFRVLLDSNHGAGSVLGRELLAELHCEAALLGDEPDGQFDHLPEPTAANLEAVCQDVVSAGAAVGFCQDPDADRLALIDETGRYVGEEFTLALCLDHVLQHTPGSIVTNCSTSSMAERIAARYDQPFFRSKVGEAHVADLMQREQAVFGGEGNGGPIDPRVGYVRDSFVGMALVLDLLAERQMPLSELVDQLPQFAIHKTTVPVDRAAINDALLALERHFSTARADRLDGLRLDWDDKWLLVRASNTEPIVRLVAEAESADQASELCQIAADVIS